MVNKPLTVCLFVALIVRLFFVLVIFPHYEQSWHLREDGDGYGSMAQSIRETGQFGVIRGPVYPGVVAVLGRMGVKWLQVALDVLTGWLVWKLAKNIWAAWLWALYPFAIWRVAFLNKETLVTFLLVTYVVLQVAAFRRQKMGWWMAAGAVLGVLNLCKPTFLIWPLVVCVLAPKRGWVTLVAMVMVILPWTIRNWMVTNGEFLPVATEVGGYTTFIGNYQPTDGLWEGPGKEKWMAAVEEVRARNARASAVQMDRAFYREAWGQVRQNPLKALIMAGKKCGRFWFLSAARREQLISVVIQLLYLGMAWAGIFFWKDWDRGAVLMILLVGYVMLLHALSYADMRFSLPAMPYVCVFASMALARRCAATVMS